MSDGRHLSRSVDTCHVSLCASIGALVILLGIVESDAVLW